MSCAHEHHAHGHGHGHGHSHGDDDSHIHPDESPSGLLYSAISIHDVTSLNSNPATQARNVIKPWNQRFLGDDPARDSGDSPEDDSPSHYLESDDGDDQLLLRIPFQGSCKLKSILVKAGPRDFTPDSIVLFTNQDPPLDFSDDLEGRCALSPTAGRKDAPAQKLESIAVSRDVVEYPLRVARFNGVRDVTLFVPRSVGGDKTRLYYVGFKGESSEFRREVPTNIIYEATPQLKDHKKIPGTEGGTHSLGQ